MNATHANSPEPAAEPGTFKLFRVAGITVFLHWMWFLVAAYELQYRGDQYTSKIWNLAEYLGLFVIVLLHEFGHAFASRSVGGKAERILLWPLGGIAFVDVPPRPGAELWSIAAGPLVNVVLLPITWFISRQLDASPDAPMNVVELANAIFWTNAGLLFFNLLPIYPLDGGQIFRALLWYVIGRAKSLTVASITGLTLAAVGGLWALTKGNLWLIVMAVFAGQRAWVGIQQAKSISQVDKMPRHRGCKCPACGEVAMAGDFTECACGTRFDALIIDHCPSCFTSVDVAPCVFCRTFQPLDKWGKPQLR